MGRDRVQRVRAQIEREGKDAVIGEGLRATVYAHEEQHGDIDLVVAGDVPKPIEVGGVSKALDLDKYRQHMSLLRTFAEQLGAEPYFYYDVGTPQEVLDVAAGIIPAANIVPIPAR